MKTGIFSSTHAIYVVSEGKQQNIFNIGNNIMFGRNCNKTIDALFKKFRYKRVSNEKLIRYAQATIKQGELYICSKNLKVCRINISGHSEIGNLKSKNFICRTVDYSHLVDCVLDFITQNDSYDIQFGFICKESAKTLYGKYTNLHFIPEEYSKNGKLCNKKTQKNLKEHQKLISHLEAIAVLSEKNKDIAKKSESIDKEHKLKYKIYEIINNYLIPNSFLTSIFVKSGFSETELSDLVNDEFDNIIISLRHSKFLNNNNKHEQRHEKAHKLCKIYSGKSKVFKYTNSIVLSVDKKETKFVLNELSDSELVREVRKPYEVKIPKPIISPIDIKSTKELDMWNLDMIGVYDAWLKTKGEGVKIGIIDSGVDYYHENLKDRFDLNNPGFDFILNNKKPMDENGHGTHVAGTAAGLYTGVAPASQLYALKVLDRYGCGSEIDVILALEYAIDHSLDVVNMSIGFEHNSIPLGEACKAAVENGVLICAAAGNDPFELCYPGDYRFPGIISFAAVDSGCKRPYWSRVSENNDLSAPGVNVASSVPGGYALMSGTSMATPHGAGSAALVISYINQAPESIEKIMENNAEKIGARKHYGFGLVRPDLVLMAQRKKQLMLALG